MLTISSLLLCFRLFKDIIDTCMYKNLTYNRHILKAPIITCRFNFGSNRISSLLYYTLRNHIRLCLYVLVESWDGRSYVHVIYLD